MRSRSSPDRSRLSVAWLVALLALAAALWASLALALVHPLSHEPGQGHAGEKYAHYEAAPARCLLVDQLTHLAPLAGRSVSAGLRLSF